MLLHFASVPTTSPWAGVLVVHSSADTDIARGAADVAAILLQDGLSVELRDIAGTGAIDPDHHDVVIVAASLSDGGRREVASWIEAHRLALADRPTALFTVAGGDERARRDARRELKALAAGTDWQPARVSVVADAAGAGRLADEVAILAAAPLAA